MTMFDSKLIFVLLAVLAPSLGSQPEPNELPDKLESLLVNLRAAKADFQCIFEITNQQCPCLDPNSDCFETTLLELNSTLCDLISDLERVIASQPIDCPPLEGCAALVAGCSSSDIAVVDPVGTILPSIDAGSDVSALTVCGSQDSDYSIYYITNDLIGTFIVFCLALPNGTISSLGSDVIGLGIGIACCGDDVFVSIEDNDGHHVLLRLDMSGNGHALLTVACSGIVRAYNRRVYFSNCKEIQCVNKSGEDLETKVKFSTNIKSFDVVDEERIVFCDTAGGLWIYNINEDCFKLLDCNATKPCCDVKINNCTSLIYVAYSSDADLDIFNPDTCEKDGTLTYTTSEPTECPRLEFKPPCD
ncbi:uncharacterized protein LOC124150976 [Haliotis rufescens]|uniref:uncharacterized protein LOC124150976 n=1 Tax=Haliotis rufescens TaxID=6454 RepID=UPI001EAFA55B|nr:uncharacterized protein LOC124150976 [Haliotis rufescens]